MVACRHPIAATITLENAHRSILHSAHIDQCSHASAPSPIAIRATLCAAAPIRSSSPRCRVRQSTHTLHIKPTVLIDLYGNLKFYSMLLLKKFREKTNKIQNSMHTSLHPHTCSFARRKSILCNKIVDDSHKENNNFHPFKNHSTATIKKILQSISFLCVFHSKYMH